MGYKVVQLLKYPLVFDEKAYKEIGAEVVVIPCSTEDEIREASRDADAVITALQPITRKVIEGMEKCRIIQTIGIGYEGVDLDAATEKGILVSNVPDYCLEEVSDQAMALLLACARKLFPVMKAVREGKWDSIERPEIRYKIWPPMFRLRGQTLGIIGFGRIARTLVPKAKGFGMRIIAYDPYVDRKVAEEMGVELVDLDRLLEESDFVSIHALLSRETHHLIGERELRKMKKTAYIINTARGAIIDEKALIKALKEGWIAGAGLDVLEKEPPDRDNPLLFMDNVIVTAHSGHYSETAHKELLRRPGEEVLKVLKGGFPTNIVNPKAKEKYMERWGVSPSR